MQELLHEHEGVAGVITAFVALVSLENYPLANTSFSRFQRAPEGINGEKSLGHR